MSTSTLEHISLFQMATKGIDLDLINIDYLARIKNAYKDQLAESRDHNLSHSTTITPLLSMKIRGLEVYNAIKAFGPDHGIQSVEDAKCLRLMLCTAVGICGNVLYEYVHGYQGTNAVQPHHVAERQCGMRDENYRPIKEWE